MTSVLTLLDQVPTPDDSGSRESWCADVGRSLDRHSGQWREAVEAQDEPLSQDRAWAILGWVEDVASQVVRERRGDLVTTAAFALSLLEGSPLDRRDVMVVAALLRRATELAGLEFTELVRAGCGRAGDLGAECLEWLWWASAATPATHEETGAGPSFRFRRKPSGIDVAKLEQWLKKDS